MRAGKWLVYTEVTKDVHKNVSQGCNKVRASESKKKHETSPYHKCDIFHQNQFLNECARKNIAKTP